MDAEGKSVEDATAEQQADSQGAEVTAKTPAAKRAGNMQTDAERTRARQALELQRERILSERTASPHRRSALSTALASVEEQLAELGWMLHL